MTNLGTKIQWLLFCETHGSAHELLFQGIKVPNLRLLEGSQWCYVAMPCKFSDTIQGNMTPPEYHVSSCSGIINNKYVPFLCFLLVPGLCTFHVNSHLQSGAVFVFSCRFQKWPTSTASNGFNIANCRFATLLVLYQKDHRLLHRFRWPFCWLKTHSTSLTYFYPLSIHPVTRVFFCMSVWRPSSAGNIARVMRWCCCWPPCRLQNNWPYLLVENTYCLQLPGCWILRLNRIDAYGSGSGASWSWNHGVPHVDASLKIRAAARAKKCPGPPGPCRPRNGLLIHVPEGHGFKFQQILCTMYSPKFKK